MLGVDGAENKIGSDGVAALGRALSVNTGLEELVLIGNDFNDDGNEPLAYALEENRTLKTLNLFHVRSRDCVGDC